MPLSNVEALAFDVAVLVEYGVDVLSDGSGGSDSIAVLVLLLQKLLSTPLSDPLL